MRQRETWLLPEGVEEWLPPNAADMESLRQTLLELYRRHGYEFIMPPMIEYMASLSSGIGSELDLDTFKVVDRRSGRMLGLRADITPQSARVDAHRLLHRYSNGPVNRLCYLGPVLRAATADGRFLHQTGAELYGHGSIASDAEVLLLMWEIVKQSGIDNAVLDIGHVGIFSYLVEDSGLDMAAVKKVLKRRAADDLEVLLAAGKGGKNDTNRECIRLLLGLHGGIEALDEAARRFRKNRTLMSCVRELQKLVELCLSNNIAEDRLRVDLAELKGSSYHNGVVFAAYRPGDAQAIASGGRYDHIGRAFGRARRATGFSAFLESLFLAANESGPTAGSGGRGAILAPWPGDEALCRKIRELRHKGECVVNCLGAARKPGDWQQCDRELVKKGKSWRVTRRS